MINDVKEDRPWKWINKHKSTKNKYRLTSPLMKPKRNDLYTKEDRELLEINRKGEGVAMASRELVDT